MSHVTTSNTLPVSAGQCACPHCVSGPTSTAGGTNRMMYDPRPPPAADNNAQVQLTSITAIIVLLLLLLVLLLYKLGPLQGRPAVVNHAVSPNNGCKPLIC